MRITKLEIKIGFY